MTVLILFKAPRWLAQFWSGSCQNKGGETAMGCDWLPQRTSAGFVISLLLMRGSR